MNLKSTYYLLALLIITISLAACAGVGSDSTELFTAVETVASGPDSNTAMPGYDAGVVPWEVGEEDLVVPVVVVPDVELHPGDGKMTMSVSTAVPFVVPEGATSRRATSALVDGGDYYVAANVGESEVQGYTFDPGQGSSYACFELELEGAAPYTVGLAWYSLPDMESYYVGIGDRVRGVWHWYYGPGDGVLTFDPTDWLGGSLGDSILVCVLLEDGLPADFQQLKSGVSEIRGTGLLFDQQEMRKASEAKPTTTRETSTLAWPTKVDLKPFAAPVGNQGSIGSCTAFAVADSAFNIMLNRMYGSYGWDVTAANNQASPMWCYVKSGISPYGSFNPPCGSSVGRYMSQPFNLLRDDGSATAATVPYVATSNCATTFPQLAYTEGTKLKIHSWETLNSFGIVDSIKEQLAVNETPVPIAMYGLESAFLYYSGGVYHYGGTQGVNGGHAMCIVGYDDELQAFEVRNSWGTGWGSGGYWWCGYDAASELAVLNRFSAYAFDVLENADAVEYFLGEQIIVEYDEVEPNNTIAESNPLPEFFFNGYRGEGESTDMVDIFSFEHEVASNTSVTVTYNPAQLVLGITMINSAGDILASATGPDGNKNISGVWSADGTSYMVIQIHNGTGSYEISGTATIPPAQPQGLTAADGSESTGIVLNWEAVTGAQSYTVQRAVSQAGPYTQLDTTFDPEYTDLSGRVWTEYWYRVLSVNGDGSSVPSAPARAVLALAPPTGVTASDGESADRITISWDPVEGAQSYTVKRGPRADGPFVTVGVFATSPAVDDKVVESMIYHYVVCSSSQSLVGPPSAPETGMAGTGLTVETDLEAVPGGQDQIEGSGIGHEGISDPGGTVVTR